MFKWNELNLYIGRLVYDNGKFYIDSSDGKYLEYEVSIEDFLNAFKRGDCEGVIIRTPLLERNRIGVL